MSTITYQIPNINCGHCVHTIKSELELLDGVRSVTGDISAKKITVEFEPPATEALLKKTLVEINYPVTK